MLRSRGLAKRFDKISDVDKAILTPATQGLDVMANATPRSGDRLRFEFLQFGIRRLQGGQIDL